MTKKNKNTSVKKMEAFKKFVKNIIIFERAYNLNGKKILKSVSIFGLYIYRNNRLTFNNFNPRRSLELIKKMEEHDKPSIDIENQINKYLKKLQGFKPSVTLLNGLNKLIRDVERREYELANKIEGASKNKESLWEKKYNVSAK